MTEAKKVDPPVRLEKFYIAVRMDVTLGVDGNNWAKPGAEGGMTWRGYEFDGKWVDPIPTPNQLLASFQLIQQNILTKILEELVVVTQQTIAAVDYNTR